MVFIAESRLYLKELKLIFNKYIINYVSGFKIKIFLIFLFLVFYYSSIYNLIKLLSVFL